MKRSTENFKMFLSTEFLTDSKNVITTDIIDSKLLSSSAPHKFLIIELFRLSIKDLFDLDYQEKVKLIFLKYLREGKIKYPVSIEKICCKVENPAAVLLSHIGIIYLSKKIIKNYKDYEKDVTKGNEDALLVLLLYYLLDVSSLIDKYQEKSEFNLLIYLNKVLAHSNIGSSTNSELLRLYCFYENENWNIVGNRVFDDFEKAYGYSIQKYIQFIMMLYVLYTPQKNMKTKILFENIVVNPEISFNFLKQDIQKEFKKILEENSISIAEAKKFCSDTDDQPYNYELFETKPFIKVDKNEFLPFNYFTMMGDPFKNLYLKIYDIYHRKGKDIEFTRKYGKVFENYCYKLAKHSVENSKFKYYEIKGEEKYLYKEQEKRTPDIIIKLNDTLLVIEIKSQQYWSETIKYAFNSKTDEIFRKEFKSKIIDPKNQMDDRMCEMIELSKEGKGFDYLKKISGYIYIIVGSDMLYRNELLFDRMIKNIPFRNDVSMFLTINLIEFEYLLSMIENRKKSVIIPLKMYCDTYATRPFREFCIKHAKDFKVNRHSLLNTDRMDEILTILKKEG